MQNMKSIFGITPAQIVKSFSDEFEILYEDATLQAVSKKTFHQDDDDLPFDYQYVVSIIDSDEYSDEKPRKLTYFISLVPVFKSLCKNKQESVLKSIGGYIDEPTAVDIEEYGLGVIFGADEHIIDTEDADADINSYLDVIANVYETMNSLRGFYLDRRLNAIGNTGWDTIEAAIKGTDIFQKAMERIDISQSE